VIVRRGGSQDVPFLRDMLRHAYYWRADEAFEDEEPLSRYVMGWGRPGDTALVAIDGTNRVGAAWYRLFTSEHPGFGYVDDETPELAIAVVPSRRGKGLGSTLLEALMGRARDEGYAQLSLSVEADSPAIELYRRQGFEQVSESDHSWTMLAKL
jgi:ribosomal protein S18 acetylase RimI-like enzyme